MATTWEDFHAIWVVDSEYTPHEGGALVPLCVVAREVRSGQTIRLWADQLSHLTAPPFGMGSRDLVVAFFASSAEMRIYLTLHWPTPRHLIDLYAENRCLRNDGTKRERGAWGLLGASRDLGLPAMDVAYKDDMHDLAIRGGPFTDDERRTLLAYCEDDVRQETQIFRGLQPHIDLPRALLRGRAMVATAHAEQTGVPIDVPLYAAIRDGWDTIQQDLITRMDRPYGAYDDDGVFRQERFERYLVSQRIAWPRTATGLLDTQDQTFKDMAKVHPQLVDLHELHASLNKLKLGALTIGGDGRNRVKLGPFTAKTGRFAPSTTEFVFGPACWIRSFVKPERGTGLVYLDWRHQELGIAAARSGDRGLQEACLTDPYIDFAFRAGAVPAHATQDTHPHERELYKTCMLGLQYGMGEFTLAHRINQPRPYAARLITQHQRAYPTFWKWAVAAQSYAMATNLIHSHFGWTMQITPTTSARTLLNWTAQSDGAEMLRVAMVLLVSAGITLCCPIHDAVLIQAPLDDLDAVVCQARRLMARASAIVLDGFELQTDKVIVRYPDRFHDPKGRGRKMWRTVTELLHLLPDEVAEPTSQLVRVGR